MARNTERTDCLYTVAELMSNEPRRIRDLDAFEAARDRGLAVVYKHSPRCGASRSAAQEIGRFMAHHPDVPVYLVDVVEDQELAREIARRLEVRHESPQVILLRDGTVLFDASHGSVSAAGLARELERG